MENLKTTYEDADGTSTNNNSHVPIDNLTPNETLIPISEAMITENKESSSPKQEVKEETEFSTEISEEVGLIEEDSLPLSSSEKVTVLSGDDVGVIEEDFLPLSSSEKVTTTLSGEDVGLIEEDFPIETSEKVTTTLSDDEDDEEDDDNVVNSPRKKRRRSLASCIDNDQLTPPVIISNQVEEEDEEGEEEKSKQIPLPLSAATAATKPKTKKPKPNGVWTKPTSRKGKKKNKSNGNGSGNCNGNSNGNHHSVVSAAEDAVLITPIPRFPDRNDDSVDMKICLSKVYKAEKVELSEDRLSAGSSKGYRMVRATRGVVEGAWYFEIKVLNLGETGHTRLGWSTDKGDLQAPVGYDGHSFGYRDVDGSKIHKALREKYGEEGYKEGDVIGFYINLPQGGLYAPKPVHLFWYKGQKYSSTLEGKDKEESSKVVPGSEICFFKNGIFQGVAFKDLPGGRYFPAASMYTFPSQPNCVVKFNFGPDFEYFPQDFEDRPRPAAMIEVPYQSVDARVEDGESVEK